jgi:hypothetical protein
MATVVSEEHIYLISKVEENGDSASLQKFPTYLPQYTASEHRRCHIVQLVSRRFPVSVAKVRFMGFMADKMVLVHVFLLVLQFPL